jgi:outer membrane protein OmpA-like peptidoglycan-associated protein
MDRSTAHLRRGIALAVFWLCIAPVGHSAFANVASTPIVLFAYGSAEIDATGQAVIDEVAGELRKIGQVSIVVAGYTDRAGSRTYNTALSRRRAEAVRDRLIAAGVPARLISVRALGEEQPAISTDDGVREAVNRRVAIVIEGGIWRFDQPQ